MRASGSLGYGPTHERPDGQGYPDGLAGDASQTARSIAVADAYDTLIRDGADDEMSSSGDVIAELSNPPLARQCGIRLTHRQRSDDPSDSHQ